MEYYQENGKLVIVKTDDFDLPSILECGQCFRFEKLDEQSYRLIAFGRLLYAHQDNDKVTLHDKSNQDYNQWISYFDLDRDYGAIKARLSKDPILSRAIAYAPGIRMLSQDPWEVTVSFIISQNNRIPQIMQVVKNISAAYGVLIDDGIHAFPRLDQLIKANAEELRGLKTGFRDKYIVDAINAAREGRLDISRQSTLDTAALKQSLLDIKGIGEKVAHCILLFGYGRYNSFPVDTWIKKVMERLYFKGQTTPLKEIYSFAEAHFGEYAGFANQYLFHYMRSNPKINI